MANTIGSGLDVSAIVDGLMGIERKGLQRLESKQTLYKNQLSAYEKIKNVLQQFSTNITNLETVLNQNSYVATSSNTAVVGVSLTSANSAAGNYNLQVQQLAEAEQIASSPFAAEDQALGLQTTLVLTQGGNSMDVYINTTDSLQNVRDYINNSLDNPGINASILHTTDVNGADQYTLLVTATNPGTANQITVSGDSSLNLNTIIQAAQDAKFTINNYSVVRGTNIISDVLDGVTFQLNSAPGNAIVSITPDYANQEQAVTAAITNLVNAYNATLEALYQNQASHTTRDNTYPLIAKNLQNVMQETLGGSSINSLLSMGITSLSPAKVMINEDGVEYVVVGQLTIDNDQLNQAIAQSLPQMRDFFTIEGLNFDFAMQSAIDYATTSTIPNRENIIRDETNLLGKTIDREEYRLDQVRKQLLFQYAAVDTYIARYQQIGNFLEQQIAMLNPNHRK